MPSNLLYRPLPLHYSPVESCRSSGAGRRGRHQSCRGAIADSKSGTVFMTTCLSLNMCGVNTQDGLQKQNSENYDPEAVSLLASSRSILGMLPASTLRTPDHNQGCCGENKLLNAKGKAVLDAKVEHSVPKREVRLHGPGNNNSGFNIFRPETSSIKVKHDKPFMPDNYGSTYVSESLSCNLKDLKHDLAYVSYLEASQNYFEGTSGAKNYHHEIGLAEALSIEGNVEAKYGSFVKLASNSEYSEHRDVDEALNSVESNHGVREIHHLTTLPQCSVNALSSEYRGRNELELAVLSQAKVSHKDKSVLIRCSSDSKIASLNSEKSKEQVNSGPEDIMRNSKKREGSHESVESSSSKQVTSRRKRVATPELKLSEVSCSKRLKSEKFSSGTSARQGSSFMNWISTLTSSHIRLDQPRPLASFPYASPSTEKHLRSVRVSHEKTEDSGVPCRVAGFRSIFEAICLPNFTITHSSSRDLDIQREVDASRGNEIARELQCSLHMVCDNFPHKVMPVTSVRISSGSKEHVSGGPLFCDGDSSNSQNQISTPSEEHKNASCSLDDKGSPFSVPNGLSMEVDRRNDFFENLWIKRLLSEGSSSSVSKGQYNQGAHAANKLVTGKCDVLDTIDVSSDKESSSSGYCQLVERQDAFAGDEMGDHLILPIDPSGAKRKPDQHVIPRLDRILPSQRFKKSEQMTSIFAKRLDAIRHIGPSIGTDVATCSTITCFFCGNGGHSIGKCSELDKTDLGDLLKNMNSFDGTFESSCICILCFQLNHWAISCPRAYSKIKHITSKDVVTYEVNDRRKDNYGSKQEGDQFVDECKNDQSANVLEETEHVEKSGVNINMSEVVSCEVNNLAMNQVEDIRECKLKTKLISLRSRENESKGKQIVPYSNIVIREVDRSRVGVFEAVRRLRLSRSEIIRWMKLPVSQFSLEGLFVRIRFGKNKGFDETGHRVACISSVNYENEKCLSVCVGRSISSVDFRSISNHDFTEEELELWWAAVLKDGGKPPSLDLMNKKIQEMLNFGFYS